MKKDVLASILLGVLGSSLFVLLLFLEKINQVCFVTLMCSTGLFSFVILSLSRLKELDLKNLKLTLTELKQVKSDIYAKEDDLKKSSKLISELILFNSLFASRFGDTRSHECSQLWAKLKAKELLSALNIPDDQQKEVFRFSKMFEKMDSESGITWEEIIDRVAEECAGHGRADNLTKLSLTSTEPIET